MTFIRRAGAKLAAVAAVALGLATVAAQDAGRFTPREIRGLAAPGIDRGLAATTEPRLARRSSDPLIRGGASGAADYLPGSVIVKFRPGTSLPAQQAILAMIGGTPTPDLPYASFDLVRIDESADAEAMARRLDAQPDVEYAQARYRVRPLFTPNDPLYPAQWNYSTLDMERAWDINQGASSSVVVAVLDSGVAYLNRTIRFTSPARPMVEGIAFPSLGTVDIPFAAAPELGGADRFVAPRDFIWDDNTPVDMDGHGTHVAGTIGQLTNNSLGVAGMAFNVKLMPVKVIQGLWDDYFGSPFVGTDDVVARGVRYAADNGANVINMSIGRTGSPAPVVQEAIAYAVSRGVFVATAAGNEFLSGNPVERVAEFAPQIDGMVAVAAIGRSRARATYSGVASYVELAAPGGDFATGGPPGMILQQTYDLDFVDTFFPLIRLPRFDVFAFELFEGTSMAAPHVSGLAAMMYQQGITDPAAIEAAMKRYATDLGPSGRDNEYGYGLINPRASLRGMGLAR